MQKKNFYLSNPHIEYLESEANRLDLSMSEILRRTLDQHIAQVKVDKTSRELIEAPATEINKRAKVTALAVLELEKIKKLKGK